MFKQILGKIFLFLSFFAVFFVLDYFFPVSTILADDNFPSNDFVTTTFEASLLTASVLGDVGNSIWDSYNTYVVDPVSDFLSSFFSLFEDEAVPPQTTTTIIPPPTVLPPSIPPPIIPPPTISPAPSPITIITTNDSSRGLQGLPGPQGPQGLQGLTGPQGPSGSSSNIDTSSFVLKSFFDNQLNGIFNSIENGVESIYKSITELVSTETLTVSGNATVGGNFTVTGTLTGNVIGTINPSFTLGSVPFQGASGLAEDNSNFFWDDANDRLGIGTSSPSYPLHIYKDQASFTDVAIDNDTATGGTRLILFNDLGNAELRAHGSTYTTSNVANRLGLLSSGNMSGLDLIANNSSQTIRFMVGGFSNEGFVRMMINGSGNVGIGTTTPASKLDVTGGLTTTGSVITLGTKETSVVVNDVLGRLNFYAPLESDGGDSVLVGASIAAIAEGTFDSIVNTTSLQFQTGASETATTKMTILSSGNVGIGTTGPTALLHVEGASGLDGATPVTFKLNSTNNGTWTDEAIISQILFDTSDASGSAGTRAAIKLYADDTTGNDNGLSFWTTSVGAGGIAERMRIDHNGNLNVGNIVRVNNISAGETGITQGMFGLELLVRSMSTTNKYTSAIKFGSSDGSFTTTNPKFLAGIVGRATEDYNADTDSGMAMDFLTTPDNAGAAPIPSVVMTISNTGNVGIGTTGPADKLHITTGNLRIGASTAVRATTAGTNQLILFDGTAPVGTLVNGISMYSTAGEAFIMDAAGNETLQSPHDEDNLWIFDSRNSYTGKSLIVDMELMMKKLNETFGWDFVHETINGVETPASGILSLDLRLEGIEERLAALEGGGGLAPATSAIEWVVAQFNDIYGVVWEQGVLQVANVITNKFTTKELCLEDVCINKAQLKELLEENNIDEPEEEETITTPSDPESETPPPQGGEEDEDEVPSPPNLGGVPEATPEDGQGGGGESAEEEVAPPAEENPPTETPTPEPEQTP